MIKDGRLSFESQLKIKFLPPNNDSKKCSEKSLIKSPYLLQSNFKSQILEQN